MLKIFVALGLLVAAFAIWYFDIYGLVAVVGVGAGIAIGEALDFSVTAERPVRSAPAPSRERGEALR